MGSKRRRTDAGRSDLPPPYDWQAHEAALNRRRDWTRDSGGESPEGCPLSDVLPEFVKYLQKLDSKHPTTYRHRWDRYCRESPCYVYGHPTKDPFLKEYTMLRGFVVKLCLTRYFLEYEAWHHRTGGAGGSSRSHASAHAASSWERSRSWR